MNDRTGWLRHGVRPLILAAMLGVIGVALVEAARLFMPSWDGRYVAALLIFLVIEVHLSHEFLKRRQLRGGDILRYRLAEAVLLFFVARLLPYALPSGWAQWEEVRVWAANPELIVLDGATWVVYIVMLVLWQSIHSTLNDFARIDGAVREEAGRYSLTSVLQERQTLRQENLETAAAHRALFNRFLQGGVVLLVATGLSLVGVQALADFGRPPVTGMSWTVGFYFLCGLMMTGLLRYVALRRKWQVEYVTVDAGVARGWLVYLTALLLLGVSCALMLPTGYSLPFLGSVAALIEIVFGVLAFIGLLIFVIITFPVVWSVWFLTALLGNDSEPPRFTPPPPPPVAAPAGAGMDWWEFARAAGLWILLIALIWFTVRTYWRDKNGPGRFPRLAAIGARVKKWLLTLWSWLVAKQEYVVERLRQSVGFGRRRSTSALRRERHLRQVKPPILLFLRLLRRAEATGVGRNASSTAYEFSARLAEKFPEVEGELRLLTDAFVEARYSEHETGPEQVRKGQSAWARIRKAMKK